MKSANLPQSRSSDVGRTLENVIGKVLGWGVGAAFCGMTVMLAGHDGVFGSRGIRPEQNLENATRAVSISGGRSLGEITYQGKPVTLMIEDLRNGPDRYFLQLPDGSRIYVGSLISDNGDTLTFPAPDTNRVHYGSF